MRGRRKTPLRDFAREMFKDHDQRNDESALNFGCCGFELGAKSLAAAAGTKLTSSSRRSVSNSGRAIFSECELHTRYELDLAEQAGGRKLHYATPHGPRDGKWAEPNKSMNDHGVRNGAVRAFWSCACEHILSMNPSAPFFSAPELFGRFFSIVQ